MFLQERSGPHLEQIIGIDLKEFQKPRLRTLAAQFVKDVASRHVTGTLWIVTSRLDSERLQGVRVTDQLYAAWRRSWMREYRITFPVGRVSVVSGSARLELRMPNGLIEKEVMAGEDPFSIAIAGGLFEIYYLNMNEIRGVGVEGPLLGYKYSVIFCSHNALPSPLTVAVMGELSRRFKSDQIQASLRVNSWIRHASLPVVYPFAIPQVPPTSQKLADPFESWCEMSGAAIECNSSN